MDFETRVEKLIENYAKYGRTSEIPRIRSAFEFASGRTKANTGKTASPISHMFLRSRRL